MGAAMTSVAVGCAQEDGVSLALKLRQAALCGDVDRVRSLLSRGADPNHCHRTDARNLPDSNPGKTALHYAAWHGRAEVVELLLLAGASPNAVRLSGDTPLLEWVRGLSNSHGLTGRDYHRCAVLLLQAKADPSLSEQAASGSALQAARSKGVECALLVAMEEVQAQSQAKELQLLTSQSLADSSISRL